jgi:hypothetical protein
VLDSFASSSEDEEVDTIEDLSDVGDLEYEDDDASSGDGVRRYLRAYNERRPGMRKSGRRTPGRRPGKGKDRINGHLGTSPYWPVGGIGVPTPGPGGPFPPVTTPQLPYCPNFSMQSTGMGPCMATQTPIAGVYACPSGTLGQGWNGPCVVW